MSNQLSSALVIRPASLNDIQCIQEIAYNTWPATYGSILPEGQVEYMLKRIYSITSLTQQLQNNHHFYLAISDNTPIGFASFSHEHDVTYKLQKLYVLPDIQKTGAGKMLLDAVEDEVVNVGGKTLLLNVNRNNPAKTFYEKRGYAIIKEEDIDIGNGYYMNDYVMQKSLALAPSPEGEGGRAFSNDEL